MPTTEPPAPHMNIVSSRDHSDRQLRFTPEPGDRTWVVDDIAVLSVLVYYSRRALTDTVGWTTNVSISGFRVKKNGTIGKRRDLRVYTGDPTDWPAWACGIAERHHPSRPLNADGTDADPEGSYV